MISTLPRRTAPVALLVTGLGSAAIALAPAARADTTTVTYASSGAEQTFTVPPKVTSVHVVAVGGRGGSALFGVMAGQQPGGFGAVVTADLDVIPGETLYVEVGGNGQDEVLNGPGAGGYNGGGTAAGGASFSGGGGGGGSDVRTESSNNVGTILGTGDTSLPSRLLVAGGGGGATEGTPGGASSPSALAQPDGTPGGDPAPICTTSASAPYVASTSGGGGTQSQGGQAGTGDHPASFASGVDGAAGRLGSGGDGGADGNSYASGGGGGGGLYGGGGGGSGGGCAGAGGGGSSLVTGPRLHNATYDTDATGTPRITISYLEPRAPLATTEPASSVGQTSATLNGVVNPEGFATSYHFAYGTDPNNESQTTADTQVDPTDSGQHDVSATIPGLSPGTTYYFRLVTHNDNGDASGQDLPFTTTAATATSRTPLATTSPASSVGWTKAQLNGVVNARGAVTTYYFEYGTTSAYGQTTAAQNVGPAWGNHSMKAPLTGLTRHTTYHFRLVATNANGTVHGVDRTFRTS